MLPVSTSDLQLVTHLQRRAGQSCKSSMLNPSIGNTDDQDWNGLRDL